MIAIVIPNATTWSSSDHYEVKDWTVMVYHEAQSFRLRYVGSASECEWYADMFNKALEKHDMETLKKSLPNTTKNKNTCICTKCHHELHRLGQCQERVCDAAGDMDWCPC